MFFGIHLRGVVLQGVSNPGSEAEVCTDAYILTAGRMKFKVG